MLLKTAISKEQQAYNKAFQERLEQERAARRDAKAASTPAPAPKPAPLSPEAQEAVNRAVAEARAWQALSPSEARLCEKFGTNPAAFAEHKQRLAAIGGVRGEHRSESARQAWAAFEEAEKRQRAAASRGWK